MKKISTLIFSRNDLKEAIDLIKSIYEFSDEVILMDSSYKEKKIKIYDVKKKSKFTRLKVFDIFALGYPDPLRMYALKKCRYDWILLLDTDERVSAELKKDLKNIIADANCDAFAIKRYEEFRDNNPGSFYTWQIRLFKKSKVLYKGIRHEQAHVNGTIERLRNSNYYIEHRQDLRHNKLWGYGKIEKLDTRLSYSLYNQKTLDYLSKIMVPEGAEINKTFMGKLVNYILFSYEKVTFRKMDQEISNFDYFFYYYLVTFGYFVKQKGIKGVAEVLPSALQQLDQMKSWRKESDSRECFEISKIINNLGITEFLDLDKEETVRSIYKKFKDKNQGIELLIDLLIEKYKKMR